MPICVAGIPDCYVKVLYLVVLPFELLIFLTELVVFFVDLVEDCIHDWVGKTCVSLRLIYVNITPLLTLMSVVLSDILTEGFF